MNIHINYNSNDYKSDIIRSNVIKSKIINPSKYLRVFFLTVIALGNIIAGNRFSYVLKNIFIGIGLAILLCTLFYLWLIIRAPDNKFKDHIKLDLNFSFTDELFIYRDEEEYHEFNWNFFSHYLLLDGYLFFIPKQRIAQAYFIAQKQLSKEQSEELLNFLSSRLTIWPAGILLKTIAHLKQRQVLRN